MGRGRQRLRGVQLQPQPGRTARALRAPTPGLPDRCRRRPCHAVHQRSAADAGPRSPWRSRRSPRTRPFTPAPRDAQHFPGLGAPRTAAFDTLPTPARRAGSAATPAAHDRSEITPDRQPSSASGRRSVQAVDRHDRRTSRPRCRRAAWPTTPTSSSAPTTATTWASTGWPPGKLTAFDTDIRCRWSSSGPGVPAGHHDDADRPERRPAPDLRRLAGAAPSRPGSTGTACCRCCTAPGRRAGRHGALIEHHGPDTNRRPRPPAAPQWQPGVLRGDQDRHLHLCRVRDRRQGVLRPRHGPARAPQRRRTAEPPSQDDAAPDAASTRDLPRGRAVHCRPRRRVTGRRTRPCATFAVRVVRASADGFEDSQDQQSGGALNDVELAPPEGFEDSQDSTAAVCADGRGTGAPGRIRTFAPASGGRCSIP